MHRHLMTSEEIIEYGTKLSKMQMPVMPLSAYGSKERIFNPNLCTLINPNHIEQVDLYPGFVECKVLVHQAPWQVHLDTTEDKKLDCVCCLARHKKYYGVRVTANTEKLGSELVSFLGAVRFRLGGEDLMRVSFWYNGKHKT